MSDTNDSQGTCPERESPFYGLLCDCALCRPVDGICIDPRVGGGCAVCDGPVKGCDPSLATETTEETERKSEGNET